MKDCKLTEKELLSLVNKTSWNIVSQYNMSAKLMKKY